MDLKRWLATHWDRSAALVSLGLASLVLIIGWFGISRTPYPAEQLPIVLSGGIGALLLGGCAATLWLSADLRDEWNKLDVIDSTLRALAETPAGEGLVAAAEEPR